MKTIKTIDTVGDVFCVCTDDGQKLYDIIYPSLKNGDKVELSFEGIDLIIPAFLNTAIGQLYGVLPTNVVDNQLKITNLYDIDDQKMLEYVVDNAKRYFSNREIFDKVLTEYI
ncbi:MAG: STAS-like domain-containing protein [Planctomycetaceae bacterium]|jgi:hypothetical protein|nr:STAS-like domain-containing protein [Planctomycetaceae bacterium]